MTPTITVPGAARPFWFAAVPHDKTAHLVPEGRASALCDPGRDRLRVFPIEPARAFDLKVCALCHQFALAWAGRGLAP